MQLHSEKYELDSYLERHKLERHLNVKEAVTNTEQKLQSGQLLLLSKFSSPQMVFGLQHVQHNVQNQMVVISTPVITAVNEQ